MASRVHFISGLPRSGSTLLSAILRQNPRFTASVTSPVASLWGALTPRMNGSNEFGAFFDNENRAAIYRGVFEGYYAAHRDKSVVFDTNRTWTARAPLLEAMFPSSRIICCVRPVGWIIDSIERLLRSNPVQTSRVFEFKTGATVYSRVETLMDSDRGLIGLPWSSLREAWFGDQASQLIVVDYEKLVRDPGTMISRLYGALDEPAFAHDFERVIFDQPQYDADLGMPGLHRVRERVEFEERRTCLPPDLFAKFADAAFWTRPELNPRGATIL